MTNPDTPIPWGRYSADQIERLVAALLLRMYKGARRVDGGGGDGGVDVLWPIESGIHVFEIKSYQDRLKTPQKRAIAKSAKTAAANNTDMVAWTLVLPLDHTPSERRWMDKDLAALAGVPVDWMGRTALEAQLGLHPDIVRSFAPGNVEELAIQMLAQYNQEQAAPPRTAGEVLLRAQRLAEQAEIVDPFYNLGVSIQPDSVIVTAWPKDEHAPPLGAEIAFQAEAGSAQEVAIEEFLTYGRPMTVASGNIANAAIALPNALRDLLPEEVYVEQVKVISAGIEENTRLDAVDGSGRVLGSLSVTYTDASTGPRGGTFRAGLDRSRYLYVAMKLAADGIVGEFEVQSRFTDGLLPADVLPALRFLDALRRAAQVRINVDGQVYPARVPEASSRITGVETMIWMAEALQRIGQAAGAVLPLREHWSDQDAMNVAFYDELLAKGQAPYTSPGFVQQVPLEALRPVLEQRPLPRVSVDGQQKQTVRLLGVEFPLPGNFTFETKGLLVAKPGALARLCELPAPPAMVEVEFIPDGQTVTTFYLVRDSEQDGTQV